MALTYDPIASQTLTSAAANVTFSSIPSTYTDLVLVWNGANTSGSAQDLLIRFNSDTATNYSTYQLYGNGSTATTARYSNGTFISGNYPLATTLISNGIINVGNYSSTSIYKTTIARAGSASSFVFESVGLWRSTSAINAILLYSSSGNISIGSTFTLYGIKAA